METSRVHLRRLTVLVPGVAAVVTAIFVVRFGDGGLSLLPFVFWAVLPYLLLGAVIILAAGRFRLSWLLASVGAVVVAAYGAWSLYDFTRSASSTAGLVFIFMPLVQLGLAVAASVVLLVELLGRSSSRPVSVR